MQDKNHVDQPPWWNHFSTDFGIQKLSFPIMWWLLPMVPKMELLLVPRQNNALYDGRNARTYFAWIVVCERSRNRNDQKDCTVRRYRCFCKMESEKVRQKTNDGAKRQMLPMPIRKNVDVIKWGNWEKLLSNTEISTAMICDPPIFCPRVRVHLATYHWCHLCIYFEDSARQLAWAGIARHHPQFDDLAVSFDSSDFGERCVVVTRHFYTTLLLKTPFLGWFAP